MQTYNQKTLTNQTKTKQQNNAPKKPKSKQKKTQNPKHPVLPFPLSPAPPKNPKPAKTLTYHKRKGTEYETPPKLRCVWAP